MCVMGCYLWDLDSCDEPGGALSVGGDIPCPACNPKAHEAYFTDVTESEEFTETCTLSDD